MKGLTKSLRTLALAGNTPRSEVLYRGTSKLPAKSFAPALAVGKKRALAMFRVDNRLEGAGLPVSAVSHHGA